MIASSTHHVQIWHAMPSPTQILEAVFREEYGRIIATLIRLSGSFDLAEESLQEAFASAVTNWQQQGPPKNPGAWLTTVAHRKLVDAVRREKTKTDKQSELEYEALRLQPDGTYEFVEEEAVAYPDDRLRLIFTCCHPSLSQEARVALTLRTLGGLNTAEIARAFVLPEATLAQRIVRAKSKIRVAGIPYQIPPIELLPGRLASVQAVLYLIFNEGYSSTSGEGLTRNDLCVEAIRLGRLLAQLSPDPENIGLLALMLLQDSRREARTNEDGELVTLEEQDRSLWNRRQIEEGLELAERALRQQRVGPYQLQAAIAALHAEAAVASETDWAQIAALYRELMRLNSSPVIALNHAAAVAMCDGPEEGLILIEAAGDSGRLDNYYLYYAARGDLLRRLHRVEESKAAYKRAIELSTNSVEQKFMKRRIEEMDQLVH
jgi:RNA polymerase sigma-70 factor (ECF subfamily)